MEATERAMSKKDEILQEATRLFAAKGYGESSMAELAKITGVAQGTIFYHFNNKEELFLSILKGFKEDIVAEFSEYQRSHHFRPGLEMIEEVISFYLYMVGKMEDRFMLLHRHDAYELAQINPTCRKYLEAIYDCLFDIFEQAILAGHSDGRIRPATARRMAMIIFTMVDGLVRFNTYNIYDAAVLYDQMVDACRTILKNHTALDRS
jgi:AcrR family transcriptional regulator